MQRAQVYTHFQRKNKMNFHEKRLEYLKEPLGGKTEAQDFKILETCQAPNQILPTTPHSPSPLLLSHLGQHHNKRYLW